MDALLIKAVTFNTSLMTLTWSIASGFSETSKITAVAPL